MASRTPNAGKNERARSGGRAMEVLPIAEEKLHEPLRRFALGLALVLAVFLCYGQHISQGKFIWDDDDYIFQNPHLPASDGLWRIWTTTESPQYYPLVFSTLWLEYQLWGLDPRGYHFVNVAFHSFNTVLIWLLLRRMRFVGAFAASVIFALHPMHVETVAWAAEHKNTMSTMFYLLALLCYWKSDEQRERQISNLPARSFNGKDAAHARAQMAITESPTFWYALMIACFILGLLCKTVIATLPVAILLLRYWRGLPIRKFELWTLAPLLAIGAVGGAVTGWYEHHHVIGEIGIAVSPEWHTSIPERMINAGRVLWFYAAKIIWPHPLNFNYPRWENNAGNALQWLWPLTAMALAVLLFAMRKRWGEGLFVAACFFAISVAPALGFVNVAPFRYSFVADHFCYLPSFGVIAAVVGLAAWLIRRFAAHSRQAQLAGCAMVVVIAGLLGWRTHDRLRDYRTVEALWRDTLEKNDRSWLARVNLGRLLRDRGEFEEAESHFTRMVQDWPDWWEPVAGGHNGIGTVAMMRGDFEKARRHFELAAQTHKHPVEARFNFGNALFELKRDAEAIEQFRMAISMQPDHPKAHLRLAMALERMADLDGAESEYRESLRLIPESSLPHLGLGTIAMRRNQFDRAIAEFKSALALDPTATHVRARLAQAQIQIGFHSEAIASLREGLRMIDAAAANGIAPRPADVNLLYQQLAASHQAAGDDAALVQSIREAVSRRAADPSMMLLLADVLATTARDEARNPIEAQQIAERLLPNLSESHKPFGLRALAAAQAGQGQFDKARATARQALQLAQTQRNELLARDLSLRLEKYDAGVQFRRGE